MVATLHLPSLYQLDEHMQAQMSLHASMEDNFPSEKTELKWLLVEDVLSLMRIRDFISLVLAYPVRIADGGILRKWINDVFEFNAMHSKEMESFLLEMQFLNFWGVQKKPDTFRRIKLLLSEKPLRYIEGLIPEDMISQIKHGWRSISNDNDTIIPEAIFNLGADLAARQLIETLFSGEDHVLAQNIHHVRLSTRNSIEKGAVVGKIVAALKDEDSVVRLKETFMGVLQIDVSKYPGDEAEIRVQQKLAQELELMITTREQTEDEGVMLRRCIEEEMMWKKYLVLLVDGDGDNMLDPRKMGFPKSKLAGVVVLITNKSSVLHQVDLLMAMDLEIRTKDHLLSWELFCKNVGSELVHSSSVIQNIAVYIVKECCGHLLAVVLVAKWLKNVEDVKLWELALEKLRYTNSSFDINNMEAMSRVMVNAFINFAWEGMSKTIKYCLMRCLFVPEIKVGVIGDHLISDWLSIELVHSREEAEHILRELVDLCLLLPLKDSIVHIRLPEESYDILELLNRANPIVITQGSLGLTRPSNVGQWHEAVQIELMKNRLSELPPSPNCCDLRVLLLHGNPNLTEIPPLFFDQMPLLRILDLSNTSLRDLPSSFFRLMGLKEFCLRGCELFVELPLEIEQLKNLEKLDLSGTPIIHLPPSPNFPKLRVLSLQGNDSLMEIPPLFFEYMPMLHILDLSYTSISDLPTSFFNLTSLRECHLRSCLLLWQLPPEIGQLKNLEKLNLEGTEIIHLPEKIQLLTNLQCLTLTFCGNYNNVSHGEKNMRYSSSTMITPGLISNFSKLIHLSLM